MPNSAAWASSPALLVYTRCGFEHDAAAELAERTNEAGVHGFCRAHPNDGLVEFRTHDDTPVVPVFAALDFTSLVFVRQWLAGPGWLPPLPAQNRLAPLLQTLPAGASYADLWLEYPDTNAGKTLSRFCRRFTGAVRQALQQQGAFSDDAGYRLHLLFSDSATVFPGIAPVANSSPWPLGIPRLRMPVQAPSRSTLKLEEALLTLLGSAERERLLRPGRTAVDLGAAPGGWTWQLARRGLRVTAVDNGPMDAALMDLGLVDHQRVDGFRFRPRRPVDWMVCDMVERPSRIVPLMSRWLVRGDCHQAVFNLKLPMKRRYATVRDGLQQLHDELHRAGRVMSIRCKQLYHDREEVTVCVIPTRRSPRPVRSR
ncbi:23S rRNA (cytidine(2498)-2'-O)-methyltransferase RlmM [Aquisalimonas sp.]|uniref:23S rRNA (cytidine(2498)-2'-O)-methyltransferase RlmM n=1 Tax=Aquisalimonas sp. TaxID=1872621 RepID=UPI0025C1C8CE|nr:23S rRNA (cytidine(2498)-2'-O)-methyltransferase RlmM [Aquisalimonas sp.]